MKLEFLLRTLVIYAVNRAVEMALYLAFMALAFALLALMLFLKIGAVATSIVR